MERNDELRERVANSYYYFTVKQGWELAGFEKEILVKAYEYADQIIPIVREDERERIMRIFASFGKIQLEKPLSGKEFEALFD